MTEADGVLPGSFGLLRHRTFSFYFFGRLSSHISVWIHNVSAAVLVYELTRSALAVGMMTAAQFLPQGLLSLWGGVLSDRYDRRKLLIMGRLPAGFGCLLLAGVVGLDGSRSLMLVTVYAVGLLTGIGWAVAFPAGHAFVPSLVPRTHLTSAIALVSITGNVARTVGPALAGVILLVGDFWMAFLIAGIGHSAFALIVLLALPAVPSKPTTGPNRVRDGLRYALARDRLWVPLAAGILVAFGMEPMLTLGPSLAVALGGEGSGAAFVATAFGVGAVTTVPLLGRTRRAWGLELNGIGGVALLAGSLVIVVLAPTFPIALAGFFVGGMGLMFSTASFQGWIQYLVDDAYRGRIMAVWALSFQGMRPAAALVLGWVADGVGPRMGALTSSLVCCIGTVLLLRRWRRWGQPMTERQIQVA